ncbi:MAG: hypothetical protein LBS59_07165 [Puniceicoccales bacterium]|jgi:hypothetical protein|nr:hypothetical protein [Puniceicoccales bacterium]
MIGFLSVATFENAAVIRLLAFSGGVLFAVFVVFALLPRRKTGRRNAAARRTPETPSSPVLPPAPAPLLPPESPPAATPERRLPAAAPDTVRSLLRRRGTARAVLAASEVLAPPLSMRRRPPFP